ncbi:MAG: exodeoxyribonuclease VII small subunit [Desulfamplus sp.]|nr:exodeoxyribonuclease VII small subunit [Desulfamplus sp.]
MAKKKTFEASLQELENIVSELESGRFSLEDAIKKFETGMKCAKLCEQKLNETEEKIALVMADSNGKITEESFENEY